MSATPLNIVILAAGKGTRMYSKMPKVLHRIGGKPMVERVIDTAAALNPQNICVVIGHGKDQVLDTVKRDVVWVEQTEQLGTGHAVKTALPHLAAKGRTLVLYGDVPLIDTATLETLLEAAGSEVGLLTDVPADPTGLGRIIRDSQGSVTAIVEEKDADAAQKAVKEINTGILVLPNAKLEAWLNSLSSNNAQGEYYLTDLITKAVADGIKVHPVQVRASHLAAGVNNKLQLAELERIFQTEQAQELLKAGVTLRDPARFDLRGRLKHGQDVVIDVNVVLEGDIEIGDNVEIGANCVIKNATIGANSKIAPFSHLEDCEVGQNNQIGPYARLRPQARLSDDVHVGNFVEIKNAAIGQSQPPHLHRRRRSRQQNQLRRRYDYCQLRRREQIQNRHRRRSPHRLQLRLSRPRHPRQQSHDRRRQRDYPQCRRQQTRPRPRPPNRDRRLDTSGKRR